MSARSGSKDAGASDRARDFPKPAEDKALPP